MSFTEIGNGFVQQYYPIFGSSREQLAGLYRDVSLLTWQSEQMQGRDAIMARLRQLQFDESVFKTDSVECQPSLSGGVLVAVNGEVLLKDERYALKFNDVFHLAQDEQGQWYVSNQMFTLVGGGQDTQGGSA